MKTTSKVNPDKANSFITDAPIIHVSGAGAPFGAFYVIGGKTYLESLPWIGRFDMWIREWEDAGSLVKARYGHNVIYDGQYLLVIGGRGNKMSEKCSITNDFYGQVACTSQTPQLTDYKSYPELYLVHDDYCRE